MSKHIRTSVGLILLYTTVLWSPLVHGANFTGVINTEYGPVRGVYETLPNSKGVKKFNGIPYAAAERFQPPKRPSKWSSTLDAVKPKVCTQTGKQDSEEDCLSLNIYVPSVINDTVPVLVYVHGGGFRIGSGLSRNPSVLVTEQNIIVVAINYRLGALGFFCSENKDVGANLGLQDQVEALKWVQRNIERFGGDPKRVTLAGHSAGGVSVSLLMLSPLTENLYINVLAMSGAATKTLAKTKDQVRRASKTFLADVDCAEADDTLLCLQNKTVDEILAVRGSFAPCVDNYVITDSKILDDGKIRKTNVMIGVNNDDGAFKFLLSPDLKGIDHSKGINRNVFIRELTNTTWIAGQTSHVTDALEHAYTDWTDPTNPTTNRQMLVSLMTDQRFIVPEVTQLRAFAKANLKSYFYYFEQRPPAYRKQGKPMPSWVRAHHGADVEYLFGADGDTLSSGNDTSMEEDKQFAKTFRTLVANFIKSSNPNAKSSPKWTEFTTEKQNYLRVNPSMSDESNLRADKVQLWTKFLPSLFSEVSPPTDKPSTTAEPKKPPVKRDKGLVALALTSVIFITVSIILFILLIYTCIRMLRLARVAKGGYSAELIEKSGSGN